MVDNSHPKDCVTDVIVTSIARKWRSEDGIVRLVILPGSRLTVSDVAEDMATYEQVTDGIKRPFLIDLRQIRSMDRAARQHVVQNSSKQVAAAALLIGSPVSRILGNFFLGFNKPPTPTRLFTSQDQAMAWLQQFVTELASE